MQSFVILYKCSLVYLAKTKINAGLKVEAFEVWHKKMRVLNLVDARKPVSSLASFDLAKLQMGLVYQRISIKQSLKCLTVKQSYLTKFFQTS